LEKNLKQEVKKEKPEIKIDLGVDISNFKMGLLKIAYEFCVDSIPEYYVTIQRKNLKSSKKRLDMVFMRKRKRKHCLSTLHISDTRALDSTT